MRTFWLALLATGLLMVTIDSWDANQSSTGDPVPCVMDDGTGFPTPTPVTK